MDEYHKIQSVFKRDPATKYKTFLLGEYSEPEFEYLAQNIWTFTEKVDGTNIRVMVNDTPGIRIGGRTNNAQLPCDLLDNIGNIFRPKLDELKEKFAGFCFYGEGYGAGIQKVGRLYRPDKSFVLFDAKHGDKWVHRDDLEGIAGHLGIEIVPVLGQGTLQDAIDWCREGFPSQWGNFPAEGLILRPKVELLGRFGQRIITKVKYCDFHVESHNEQTVGCLADACS